MIHMITGGSGSGKSAYAEDWLIGHRQQTGKDQSLLYIATMKPYGEETVKKIERHHRLRAGKGFTTLERYTDLKNMPIPDNEGILLECVSNLVANEFYREDGTIRGRKETLEEILDGLIHLSEHTLCLTIVTNEVNSDINGYSPETEQYRQMMGMVNQRIASLADRVTEGVYGIPVLIKDEQNME